MVPTRWSASRPIAQRLSTNRDYGPTDGAAEGVESQREIELMRELGCTQLQGFHIGKPIVTGETRRTPVSTVVPEVKAAPEVSVPRRQNRSRAA